MMQTQLVKKTAIIDSGDFNLSAARYLEKVEINSEFEIKRLGEIIDIVRDKPENFDGSKKYFSTGNVSNYHIGDKFKLVEFNNKPSRANILPKKGDVGFAKMKNTNKVVIIDDILEGSIFSTGFCFIRAKESVFPDYLYHLIKDKRFQESKNELTSDGIMGAIRQNDILNIEIPLPPIEIQEQIVKEIEGYQQIIDGCRQVVENYKPVIDIDPSWKIFSLGKIEMDIIDGDRGKNYPSGEDFSNDGYCLFLNTKNVRSDGFDFNNTMFINKKKDEQLRKGKLQRYDVILTTRGTVGNTAYFSDNIPYEHIRINSGMLIFRSLSNDINPEYISYFFQSENFNKQKENLISGSAQPQLPITNLRKASIPLPNTLIQKELVEKLEQERKVIEGNKELIQIYENKINARINKVWSDN